MRTGERSTRFPGATASNAYHAILILCIAFLGFIAGTLTMYSERFPAQYLSDAYRGGVALWAQRTRFNSPYPGEFWQPARTEARGVTVHDHAKAYDGLTLYTSGHSQIALLIDMDGKVVHQWSLPFSAVWDQTAAVRKPRPDRFIYYRKAHLLPNGDLLAIYVGVGDTPWGYGLVKMTKDSKPVWTYLKHTHHDLDVADDGKVYLLTQEVTRHMIRGFEHLKPPRIDDFVVVLSPDGEELKKVSVLDALLKSPYARMLYGVPWYAQGDYLHTNAIDVIDARKAANLPFAAQGQVLLSLRELGAIAVLDLDREEIVWATQGPWLGQHDPDILDNGHLLLFDNRGHYGEGGQSRVIEFDPLTLERVWSYAGTAARPFESDLRSAQQRLPNGNTLITESQGGRLLEVTPAGEIVWEYLNPERGGDAGELIPIVSWGERIDPASLDPEFLSD